MDYRGLLNDDFTWKRMLQILVCLSSAYIEPAIVVNIGLVIIRTRCSKFYGYWVVSLTYSASRGRFHANSNPNLVDTTSIIADHYDTIGTCSDSVASTAIFAASYWCWLSWVDPNNRHLVAEYSIINAIAVIIAGLHSDTHGFSANWSKSNDWRGYTSTTVTLISITRLNSRLSINFCNSVRRTPSASSNDVRDHSNGLASFDSISSIDYCSSSIVPLSNRGKWVSNSVTIRE